MILFCLLIIDNLKALLKHFIATVNCMASLYSFHKMYKMFTKYFTDNRKARQQTTTFQNSINKINEMKQIVEFNVTRIFVPSNDVIITIM